MPRVSKEPAIFFASPPDEWPTLPKLMSYLSLKEIEACPRRWALAGARYPQIWAAAGYPRVPNIAAIKGTVIHNVIRTIVENLASRPEARNSKTLVTQAMRDLGGYSLIIDKAIESALREYDGNPRALPTVERIRFLLLAEIPELRLMTQELLARLNLESFVASAYPKETTSSLATRHPLSNGIWSELELKSAKLGWHGFIDLLRLTPDYCEIRDFKTGKEKEEHVLQLHTYALLWLKDHELNPSRRAVNRLVISYPKKDIEIPTPNQGDYLRIEASLKERTERARMSVKSMPPNAVVNGVNCQYCTVRQLCDAYWDAQLLSSPKLPVDRDLPFIDIQATVTSRRGPSSWDTRVESSYFFPTGKPMLIYDSTAYLNNLCENERIRLLNVYVSPGENEKDFNTFTLRATFGNQSEYFILHHY